MLSAVLVALFLLVVAGVLAKSSAERRALYISAVCVTVGAFLLIAALWRRRVGSSFLLGYVVVPTVVALALASPAMLAWFDGSLPVSATHAGIDMHVDLLLAWYPIAVTVAFLCSQSLTVRTVIFCFSSTSLFAFGLFSVYTADHSFRSITVATAVFLLRTVPPVLFFSVITFSAYPRRLLAPFLEAELAATDAVRALVDGISQLEFGAVANLHQHLLQTEQLTPFCKVLVGVMETLEKIQPYIPKTFFDDNDEVMEPPHSTYMGEPIDESTPSFLAPQNPLACAPAEIRRPSIASAGTSPPFPNRRSSGERSRLRLIGLSYKPITLSVFSLHGLPQDPTAVQFVFDELVSIIEKCVEERRGLLHSFDCGSIICHWNAARPAPGHTKLACLAAGEVRELTETAALAWQRRWGTKIHVSCAITSGHMSVGHTGSGTARRFVLVGPEWPLAFMLSHLPLTLGVQNVVVTRSVWNDARFAFYFRLVSVLESANSLLGSTEVYEMREAVPHAVSDEWMYEIQQTEAENPYKHYEAAFKCMVRGDWEQAIGNFSKYHAGHPPDSHSNRLLAMCTRRMLRLPFEQRWSRCLEYNLASSELGPRSKSDLETMAFFNPPPFSNVMLPRCSSLNSGRCPSRSPSRIREPGHTLAARVINKEVLRNGLADHRHPHRPASDMPRHPSDETAELTGDDSERAPTGARF
eukprot:TRINITY_DN5300_c0_g1_i1.p1 TRINITY_DN5300_c0_g1~~TRINITY_DN5300_c0_g1_i1.p1  ORF type:complete len:784 (+),score=77.59 TRINITY_DN5300_c0_g1_i1:266-2353(+)